AGHRAVAGASRVIKNRSRVVRRRTEVQVEPCALIPFVNAPAVISAERYDIDLFARALADVTCPKLMRSAAVERPTPRITHADRIDLVESFDAYIRIILRYRIRESSGRICHIRRDAKEFTEILVDVLRAVSR